MSRESNQPARDDPQPISTGPGGPTRRGSWPAAALALVLKVAVVYLFFAAWWAAYDRINRRGAEPARAVFLTPPSEQYPGIIRPWTAPIYVFGGLSLPLIPFAYYRSWSRLGFVLACYGIASALAFACFLCWPLGIVRPAFGGTGFGEGLMRKVFSVDLAANCFPSSHVFYAVLGAILIAHGGAGPVARRSCWALAAGVCATTITTGQHYFIDIAGGVAVALLGFLSARGLMPWIGSAPPAAGAIPVPGIPGGLADARRRDPP